METAHEYIENEWLEKCAQLLEVNNLTIAFAESATAGMLMSAFSRTSSSGKILKGGVVCYDACLKEDVLKVPKKLIEEYTPESKEVTEAIAFNLKNIVEADIYIGITGLTKPGGSETLEKPVGTMFTCICYKSMQHSWKTIYPGSEADVVRATIIDVCKKLVELISKKEMNVY